MSERSSPVLLVTGGARGIGLATARLAASRGFAVAVNFQSRRESAEAAVEGIRLRAGANRLKPQSRESVLLEEAVALQADISVESEVVTLFEAVDRELGSPAALVNNAATLEAQTRVDSMDGARLKRMFATNAIGTMLCAREAVKRMSTRFGGSGGAIVNVSSGAAKSGAPGEYVDYAATKGAVESFTIGLAREVAEEGIRVNGVRPGFIYTDFHAKGGEPARVDRVKGLVPMKRGGEPGEVAEAIVWLLSDQASYVTGTFIDVAGGR